MLPPLPTPPIRALRARGLACLALALLMSASACARSKAIDVSTVAVLRDRATRAEISQAIAKDHLALADLIAADRFAQREAVYGDPELREIALRLIEQTRALIDLSPTDILTPGLP